MRVSVLMPTRNRASLLLQAIGSLRHQTRPPDEIIIIDDGSDDGTAEAVAALGNGVTLLRQDRGGKSKALNLAHANSSGDAVLVLDDDDLLPPRSLEMHVNALEKAPDADFSYGRFQRFRGAKPPSEILSWPHPDAEYVPVDDPRRTLVKLMENCFLPNPSWMARRSALDRAGPYDEKALRSQDFDMILRLARRNDGAFVDDLVLYQRQHEQVRDGVRAVLGNTTNVGGAWVNFDRQLFEKLDREWSLEDFRPYHSAVEEQGEAVAWLQKAVVLFIRKAYDGAFIAFDRYRDLLGGRQPGTQELAIANSLLACRYGIDDLVFDPAGGVIADRLSAYPWPISLRRSFSRHLRWRLRDAATSRQWKNAAQLARFGVRAFGPTAWLQSTLGMAGVRET